jgi:two-component system OmpR family sensor kinase
MLQEKRQVLQTYSKDFIFRLKDLHLNFDKYKFYPKDEKFNSAIFDSDKKQIYSTLQSNQIEFEEISYLSNDMIHFIQQPESYYLGSKYIVIEIKDDKLWEKEIFENIIFNSILGFLFMSIVGFFISRLFLKPMRDAVNLLDRFIKDTSHELNTPISSIITNIELIDKSKLDDKLFKKVNRIDIASKTISNIYEDLTYISLGNKILSQNEYLDLSRILHQRCEYFKSLAKVKKIEFILDIKEDIYLFTDYKKISKLIDNLLSNAIKYNKVNGEIEIKCEKNFFYIKDSGIGIKKENLNTLFDRYSRFSKTVGGFGIGLNIVSLIVKEYDFDIKVESQLNKGTKIQISWQN